MSPTDVTAHAPDPWSTPERVALRRLARDFVAREIAPNMAEWERDGELPRDLHRKAAGGACSASGSPKRWAAAAATRSTRRS